MKNVILFVLFVVNFSVSAFAECVLRGYPKTDLSFPESLEGLVSERVISGGTGGVLILKDPKTNQKYTLKSTKDQDHFKEEILTDAFYRVLGVDVPDFALYTSLPASVDQKNMGYAANGIFRLAHFKEPHEKSSDNEKKKLIKDLVKKKFIFDAYLSNWDIVEDLKNVVLDKSNRLWRVDNGGGLRYRAKGVKKENGKNWEIATVSELKTLRDKSINSMGSEIYGSISDNEIKAQVRSLLRNSADLFVALDDFNRILNISDFDALKTMLVNRLLDLQSKFLGELQPGEHHLADPYLAVKARDDASNDRKGTTSAGIFLISEHQGQKVVLLGKRVRANWFGNLGGKSDAPDGFVYKTAAREVFEESMKLVKVSHERLLNAPSHDFIDADGSIFRTYFIMHHYIDAKHFNKALEDSKSKGRDEEYTEFKWVSLERFIESVMHGPFELVTHGKGGSKKDWTCKVDDETQLHPPLFNSSREVQTLDVLRQILAGKTPTKTVTQSRFSGYSEATGPSFMYKVVSPKIKVYWPQPTTIEHMSGSRLVKVADDVRVEERQRDNEAVKQQITHSIVNKGELNMELLERENAKRRKTEENKENVKFSATEAYLNLVQGNNYTHTDSASEKVNKFLDNNAGLRLSRDSKDSYDRTMAQVLETEIKEKDKNVFYHATMPCYGFMYDLYTEFRRQITLQTGKSWAALRATDTKFAKFKDVVDFFNFFSSKDASGDYVNNNTRDGYGYQEMGISTNPFLFGSDRNDTSASYYLFFNSQSVTQPSIQDLFGKFAKEVGLKTDYNRYEDLYNRYYETKFENLTKSELLDDHKKRRESIAKNGRLYQIVVDPSVTDTIAYMAKAGGRSIIFKGFPGHQNDYIGTKDTLALMKNDPSAFVKELGKAVYSNGSSSNHPDLNDVQTRVFLKPEVMYSDKVKVHTYWRHPLKDKHEASYRQQLREFVKSDVIAWLRDGVSAGVQTYNTAATSDTTSMLKTRKAADDDDDNDAVLPVKKTKKIKRTKKRTSDDAQLAAGSPADSPSKSARKESSLFETSDHHLPKLQRLYKKVVEGVLKEETSLGLASLPISVVRGDLAAVEAILEESTEKINEFYGRPSDPRSKTHLLSMVPSSSPLLSLLLYCHGATLKGSHQNLSDDDKKVVATALLDLLDKVSTDPIKDAVEDSVEDIIDLLLSEYFEGDAAYEEIDLTEDHTHEVFAKVLKTLLQAKRITEVKTYLNSLKGKSESAYSSVLKKLMETAIKSADNDIVTLVLTSLPEESAVDALIAAIEQGSLKAVEILGAKFGKVLSANYSKFLKAELLNKNLKVTDAVVAMVIANGADKDAVYLDLIAKGFAEAVQNPSYKTWLATYYAGKKGEATVYPIAGALDTVIARLKDKKDCKDLVLKILPQMKQNTDPQAALAYLADAKNPLRRLFKSTLSGDVDGLQELIMFLQISGFKLTDATYGPHQVLEDVIGSWQNAPTSLEHLLTKVIGLDKAAGYYTSTGVAFPLLSLKQKVASISKNVFSVLAKQNPKGYARLHRVLTKGKQEVPAEVPVDLTAEESIVLAIQMRWLDDLETLLKDKNVDLNRPFANTCFESKDSWIFAQTMLPLEMANGDFPTMLVLIKYGAKFTGIAKYAKLCDEKRDDLKKLSDADLMTFIKALLPMTVDFSSYVTTRLFEIKDQKLLNASWSDVLSNIKETSVSNNETFAHFLRTSLLKFQNTRNSELELKAHEAMNAYFKTNKKSDDIKDKIFDAIRKNDASAFEAEVRYPTAIKLLRENRDTILELAVKSKAYDVLSKLTPKNAEAEKKCIIDIFMNAYKTGSLDVLRHYLSDSNFKNKGYFSASTAQAKLKEHFDAKTISKQTYDEFMNFISTL